MSNLDSVIQQLTEERDRLEEAIASLESMPNGAGPRRPGRPAGRRVMSLAARRRIAAAQRERWREFRQKRGGQAVRTSRGRPGGFSPEHLAKLRAAAKKRWAKVTAEKKK